MTYICVHLLIFFRGQPIEIRCTKNDRQEDNGMITNIKTEPVSIEQEQHLREVCTVYNIVYRYVCV